jgi:hypothetical protein
MTANSSALSLCLLLTALGPCTEPEPLTSLVGSETAPRPGAPPDEESRRKLPQQQQTQTTTTFMRTHATEADEMRHAVIAGRFDLVHRVSAVMAGDAWSANLRPDYVPGVTAVRQAARAALDARSMQAAGEALGQLGAACASCHREQGGPPEPASVELPSDGVGAMAAHAGAERALWEGLFTPSEASWKRGAQRLTEAPELGSDIADINALGHQLRDLALEATGSAPRADMYGRILATCSTCHRRLSIETH